MSQAEAKKKERAKKAEKKIYMYYKIDGEKLVRNRKCPRCGVFMAHHTTQRSRWSCGSCTYTEYEG